MAKNYFPSELGLPKPPMVVLGQFYYVFPKNDSYKMT